MTSLNPVLTIGKQVSEPLMLHLGMTKTEADERAVELLRLVGIPEAEKRLNDYPHQFSGGMRQRVMIAMALACNPQILIADEPTTALDVTIQAQIVDLVKRLRDETGHGDDLDHPRPGRGRRPGPAGDRDVRRVILSKKPRSKSCTPTRRTPTPWACWTACRAWTTASAHRLTDHPGPAARCCSKNRSAAHLRRAARMCLTAARKTRPCWISASDHRAACWWNVEEGRAALMTDKQHTLLQVDNLVKHFPILAGVFQTPGRRGARRGWHHFRHQAGRDVRPGGRIGLRQIDHRAHDPAAVPPTSGHVYFDDTDLATAEGRRPAPDAPPDADDLPGSVCQPEPAHDRRRDHRRAAAGARHCQGQGSRRPGRASCWSRCG